GSISPPLRTNRGCGQLVTRKPPATIGFQRVWGQPATDSKNLTATFDVPRSPTWRGKPSE
ncbi:MAG: hypothetical protein ACKPBF_03745, partial [Actinomycetota bacterium]